MPKRKSENPENGAFHCRGASLHRRRLMWLLRSPLVMSPARKKSGGRRSNRAAGLHERQAEAGTAAVGAASTPGPGRRRRHRLRSGSVLSEPAPSDAANAKDDEGLAKAHRRGTGGTASARRRLPTALQNQLNSLETDFVNRDDPAQRSADRQRARQSDGRKSNECRRTSTRRQKRSATSRRKPDEQASRQVGFAENIGDC